MTSSALEFDDLDEDSVKHLLSFFGPRELLTLQTVRRARRRAGRGRPTGHTARAARTLACSHLHIKHLHRNTKHASARLQRGGHACHRVAGVQEAARVGERRRPVASALHAAAVLSPSPAMPRMGGPHRVCRGPFGVSCCVQVCALRRLVAPPPPSRARADRRRRIF